MSSINPEQWTLYDKIIYGGFGYGSFCLPTNFFKVIITVMFPPLGEMVNIIEDTISKDFPFFTLETFNKLLSFDSLNKIIYSFILTTLFYIPGLIYTLSNIVNKERKTNYNIIPNQKTTIFNKTNNNYDTYEIKTSNGFIFIYKNNNIIIKKSINELSNNEILDLSNINNSSFIKNIPPTSNNVINNIKDTSNDIVNKINIGRLF